MNYQDQVLALFGEANPVSERDALEDFIHPRLEVFKQRSGKMTETKVRAIDPTRPIAKKGRRRGLVSGLAAAVVALIAGTVTWIAIPGNDGQRDTALAGEPEAVVRVFFEDWTAGNVETALGWLHPNARFGGSADNEDARHFMEYVVALEPSGWSFSVTDCQSSGSSGVNCTVALVGDPVIDALGLEGRSVSFGFQDGRVLSWNVPNYGPAETELRTYAETRNPGGFEAVCGAQAQGARPPIPNGNLFSQECGAFLQSFQDEVAAGLGG